MDKAVGAAFEGRCWRNHKRQILWEEQCLAVKEWARKKRKFSARTANALGGYTWGKPSQSPESITWDD